MLPTLEKLLAPEHADIIEGLPPVTVVGSYDGGYLLCRASDTWYVTIGPPGPIWFWLQHELPQEYEWGVEFSKDMHNVLIEHWVPISS